MAVSLKGRKLTNKQEIFAQEFVKTDNASQAYRIAYSTKNMTDKSVNELASRNLKKVNITSRIDELHKIAAEVAENEFKIDSKELLNHLNILRKARIDEYVQFIEEERTSMNPITQEEETRVLQVLQFKPFDQLTKEQLMCIESIKETRQGIELKLHGKDWTIEKIAKHIGFYKEDNAQKNTPIAILSFDPLSNDKSNDSTKED